MHKKKNKKGYSVIAAIMMIGFLLVLVTGTLNIVMGELKDGRGRQNYIKAYSSAEGAMELALIEIKNKGYGFSGELKDQELFGSTPGAPRLSYAFESKVDSYKSSIGAYESIIIPLFWIDDEGVKQPAKKLELVADDTIAWNIIKNSGGISGNGSFSHKDRVGEKTFDETRGLDYDSQTLEKSLSGEDYLLLYNSDSLAQDFHLSTLNGEEFTLPVASILSQGKVGKYTQNIKTSVDNTEFLGILRYSIFSQ